MTESINDVQLLLLRMPCFHWINIEQLWALWKRNYCNIFSFFLAVIHICTVSCVVSNSSVNHALVSTRHLQDKFRLENLSWRLWHRHQQKKVTFQQNTQVTPTSSNNKFFMTMDDDEDDCYSTSSTVSSCSEDEWFSQQKMEDDLVFEKKRDHDNHLYFTTNKQPISLLTQMLQNNQQEQKVQPKKQQLLKRCQSRYQSLDEWFTTSS
jgi:hypothetical protein